MAKTGRTKSGAKSASRREELRKNLPKPALELRSLFERPELIKLWLIMLGFVLITTFIVTWSMEQIKVRDGRVMTQTRLKRLDYQVLDVDDTNRKREAARRAAPQVWRLNSEYLDALARSLDDLPALLGKASTIANLDEQTATQFGFTSDDQLGRFESFVVEGQTSQVWKDTVTSLVRTQFSAFPLLSEEDYRRYTDPRDPSSRRQLRQPDGRRDDLSASPIQWPTTDQSPEIARVQQLVTRAGFPQEVAAHVLARVLWNPESTLTLDRDTTAQLAATEAAAVEPVYTEHERGEVIYQPGEHLDSGQYNELRTEAQMFAAHASWGDRWLPRFGALGLVSVLSVLIGAFIMLAYPRVTHNSIRLISICALMAVMLALSTTITAQAPNFIIPAAVAPTLVIAIILLLSYDQRMAVFVSAVHIAIVCLALEQGIGLFILLLAGSVTMISQLREVRSRSSVTRAALVSGVMLMVGTLVLGVLETRFLPGVAQTAMKQVVIDAFFAGVSAIAVGFLMLGILPSIERWFDITTGMTLAELRDPKQPLLRQLQQKAPGTYNHSLQVANVAEAAADAIGADSLLVYVGALYHDIGKLNKPEYFVENQAGGFNKHDKLSPAMSLLVIIGHVKDGVELAREYRLPRQLIHFIESHHGTTLVEYFYHAARTQAELDAKSTVKEVEFRYPGPRPRTREAAILMLSDAVESATRAMSEPNPSRIENLVRELAHKRLVDGQFDACNLTFRDLAKIEDAIISRVCSIYHGRISYPGGSPKTAPAREEVIAAETGVRPITA